ncbi:hypothetical protein CEP54_007532 [Fusarium duplospermum]|uniref:Uncharacterized protein n=1 Tax=Fusarium duplospermum TaxID=1325734 RepID=A0A428Q0Y0_9HYPO|nr:hypothetical protein CEP54_007532 [Fusarium duplospermum]
MARADPSAKAWLKLSLSLFIFNSRISIPSSSAQRRSTTVPLLPLSPSTRRLSNMCTTTITRFYCIVCSYLVSFEQDEEPCEYHKSKTPEKCKLAIDIKQKSVDPQQCHKCEAKLKKKKKTVK